MEYSYKREGTASFTDTVGAVERSIVAHGFTVDFVHDIQATLASKGFAIEPLRIYEISGRRRLLGDGASGLGPGGREKVDLLMPCKVNVYTERERVVVAAVLPTVMCRVFPEARLDDVAVVIEAIVIELVDEAVAEPSVTARS